MAITRRLDAPRDVVWGAWTNPERIARWWGPMGFTTTTDRMDVRPGGEWLFTMHGPDGRDYRNRITYVEVVRPERLVYRHGGGEDVEPVSFEVTTTFIEDRGGTRLHMRMVFPSAKARTFVIDHYGALDGLTQTVDRLAATFDARP